MDRTLELCSDLIRRPSVTPEDAGCQALMMERNKRAAEERAAQKAKEDEANSAA